MSNFLIRADLAVFRDGSLEKGPAFLRFVEVKRRGFRKLLFEFWRRSTLSQRGDGSGGHGGCFWINNLRVAMVRQNISFIFPLARVHQKIEPAVGVLHSGEEISLPFCFLQQIAFAIAAFFRQT